MPVYDSLYLALQKIQQKQNCKAIEQVNTSSQTIRWQPRIIIWVAVWADEIILYLDCACDYVTLHICQTSEIHKA